MKHLLYAIIFLLPSLVFSQIGLGTRDPDPSAVLELESSDKGLLIPRLSGVQRDEIDDPATGLIIYNADINKIEFNSGTPDNPVWTPTSSTPAETTGGPRNPDPWFYAHKKYNRWNVYDGSATPPVSSGETVIEHYSGGKLPEEVTDEKVNQSSWIDFFHRIDGMDLVFGVGNRRGPGASRAQTWQFCVRNSGNATITFEYMSFVPFTGGNNTYKRVEKVELPPGHFYSTLHSGHSLWLTSEETQPVTGYIFVNSHAYEYKAMATRRKNDAPEKVYAGIGYRSLGSATDNTNLIVVLGKVVHEVIKNRDEFWNAIITRVIGTMRLSPSKLKSLIRAIGEAVPIGVQAKTGDNLRFYNFVLGELGKKRPLTNDELEALIEEIVKTVPAAVQSQTNFWVKVFDLVGSGQLSDKTMQALILAIPVLSETHNSLYGGFNFQ